ncbi:MAG TPA: histidinol-phosphatase HisJ family protein [Clostridia bacterium]|nr:histidinol-phosphatase HisJ family protein [Clostridia bacterium]
MVYDCHLHPLGHEGGTYQVETLKPFIEEALKRGLAGIGFTDHDWFLNSVDYRAVNLLREEYQGIDLLFGLEVDYRLGREQEIQDMISSQPFDYVIGSVHEMDGWLFDHPDFVGEYDNRDIYQLYRRYFSLMKQMVASGLFQMVGHLDLIKVFGYRVPGGAADLAEPVLQEIRKYQLVVEVNTNGLYKPVREMYPAEDILSRCFQLGIPVTLSSDAHQAGAVGRDFSLARSLLKRIGYNRIAYFRQRTLYQMPL